ncbi:histone-lysine N-methyltransferase, H3 lysine-9 specific SUVH5-like [Spinacia oleracea]|uniref:Histone-lysine N-methyltransferase, H3 lysine-9 specific SUVH5-like n=1 Tax=Spinacia oleracea TaxID=3562 RepID=A0A9R0I1X2_SPIOL|nr:histone-lysine N-methyltransferase, H3 lysine-9 specific SUVH5-like [Spinacia oleracea]
MQSNQQCIQPPQWSDPLLKSRRFKVQNLANGGVKSLLPEANPALLKESRKPHLLQWTKKGENLKIKEENADHSKPRRNFASDEKSKEPIFSKMENRDGNSKMKGSAHGSEGTSKKPQISGKEDGGERSRVSKSLDIFRRKCIECICCNFCNVLGRIPGVEVGDRFEYRVELNINIVGLHGRIQHGIDYTEHVSGTDSWTVATCVVSNEGYEDQIIDCELITYAGEGGKEKVRELKLQAKLMEWRREPVTYFYDGLYKVVSYEEKTGPSKNVVFDFKLNRCPGQPVVPWELLKKG